MKYRSRMTLVGCIVVAISLLVMPVRALCATDEDVLEIITLGLAYHHDYIQTFKGSMEVTHWQGDKKIAQSTTSGSFDGTRFRISFSTVSDSPTVIEGLFDGTDTTEWLNMSANERGEVLPGLSGLTAVEARNLDPRNHVISRLAKDANQRVVGRETLDGDSIVLVEQSLPSVSPAVEMTTKLWVNASKGFTIPIAEIYTVNEGGERSLRQRYVSEYKDYGEDTRVLSEYVVSFYDKEGHEHTRKITKWNSDFQINAPVDEGDFTLELPSGLTVHDRILDEEYVVP